MSGSTSNNGLDTGTSHPRSPGNLANHTNNRSNLNNIRRGTNLRGRLIDGTWRCDCDPRLPAVHFQTRNGGKHHGRWFYTCQKPQNKRCGFFLWDDDAKARAMMTGGVRSTTGNGGNKDVEWEDGPSTPKTPSKKQLSSFSHGDTGLLTPDTGRKRRRDREEADGGRAFESPTKTRRRAEYEYEEDPFGSEDLDEEFASGSLDEDCGIKRENPRPHHTPVAVTQKSFSSQISDGSLRSPAPPASVHNEPSSCPPLSQREACPSTPTPTRFSSTPLTLTKNAQSQSAPADAFSQCSLVSDTLALLDSHHIALPSSAKEDLISLLNTHDLRTKGVTRGRDISRVAIKKKEEHIQELMGRIEVLEAEREAWRPSKMNEKDVKQEPD